MIFLNEVNNLNEDELALIIYLLKDSKPIEITEQNLKCVRKDMVAQKVTSCKPQLKSEHQHMVSDILSKLNIKLKQ